MRSLAKLTQYFIAIFLVIQILRTVRAAPLETQLNSVYAAGIQYSDNNVAKALESARQASEDYAYEDSDEDDGEDDAEQAQQSLIQQNQDPDHSLEESQEASDEVRHRRRRDVEEIPKPVEEQQTVETANNAETPAQSAVATVTAEENNAAAAAVAAATSLNRTSVLILIRDALKKVTTVLPTETVATNALQYFQLFEHFIQQTIEQVIEDYDEDEEETTTAAVIGSEILPEKQQTVDGTATNTIDATKEPVAAAVGEPNKMEQAPTPAVMPETASNTIIESPKETEMSAEKPIAT